MYTYVYKLVVQICIQGFTQIWKIVYYRFDLGPILSAIRFEKISINSVHSKNLNRSLIIVLFLFKNEYHINPTIEQK